MKNSLMITFLILCSFSLFTWSAQAQNRAIHVTSVEDAHEHTSGRNCHAHINLQNQMQADPTLEQRMMDMETKVQDYVRQRSMAGGARFTSRTIPVYVHVLYRTSQENISDAQIQSQIDQINADFAATNADYNPPSDFASVASGDTKIQFVLAPNGIKRKSTNKTSWGTNDAMKKSSQGGLDPITPSTHLNMWVCNIGGGILGYAQFPGGSSSTDGVVMSPQYFGSRNYGSNPSSYYLSAPFDRGRTTTHEIGHYLNLRHIWGDGGCNVDDGVSDTPVAGQSNGGCPSSTQNTCAGGLRDMHMNYMDYTNDACMYMFSNGQKLRMQACLDGVRSQLGTSGNGGGGNPPTCSGTYANVSLRLITDNYGSETSWTVKDASGATVASGSGYGNNRTINEDFTLADGQYTFTINDSYGDGICCAYGSGSYTLTGDGTSFKSGGSFGNSESTVFCVENTTSSCSDVDLTLNFDNYPEETSWTITNSSGSTVASGGAYGSQPDGSTINITECLDAGCYTFTITDSYGDGICCSYGNGSYLLESNGTTLASGGSFTSSDATQFCVGGASRTATGSNSAVELKEVDELGTKQISLYPNPAGNTINVDLGEITTNYTGRIVDATGRTVWVGELEAGANAINISTLSTGMYYVAVVKADGEVITKKFVKK